MKQILLILFFGLTLQAQDLSLGEPLTKSMSSTEESKKVDPKVEESDAAADEENETKLSDDTKKAEAPKKEEKKKVPLRIKSASSSYNEKKGLAIFKRDVVVEDGDFYLECDEMHVFYAKATKTKKGGIEKIVAMGNVKIRRDSNTATSTKAVYLLTDQTITLTGTEKDKPVLIGEDGQKMKSDFFIIHRETETIESGQVSIESDTSLEKANKKDTNAEKANK